MRTSGRVSFVATVLNEERTISALISSLLKQSKKLDEIIIVDGGSTDATVSRLHELKKKYTAKNLIILVKQGNRSVGRNFGIEKASGSIIVLSDAGCTPDKKWVEKITEPFRNPRVDVVAGYYAARPKTVFEKCLVPYVFVMPDVLNPTTFLPATRSMALRKNIWKKAGRFDHRYSHNEDYVFARKLRRLKVRMVFKADATVYWKPRQNFIDAFTMFYRFALGDAEAGIIRPKVFFIFFRYTIFVILLVIVLQSGSPLLLYCFVGVCIIYAGWSVSKNYRYIRKPQALFVLPLLQITSDLAVLIGTSRGALRVRK